MRPPGSAITEPGRGVIRSEGDTALSIRKAKWHLVDVLGYSPIAADRTVRGWVVARHEAAKAAEWAERLCGCETHADLARLMAELPLGMRRGLPSGVRAIRAEPKRWRTVA